MIFVRLGDRYEGSIIAPERLKRDPKKAFIPLLRGAEGLDTLPIWARGIYASDLRGDPYSQENWG